MNKKELVRKLIKYNKQAEEWLDSVPKEIQPAFFDNPWSENHQRMIGTLIDYTFRDPEEHEWVCWLYYEWHDGLTFSVHGVEYEPMSIEQAVDMVFGLGLVKVVDTDE